MVGKRRIGYSGLLMGASIAAMFLVTDALDIGGFWPKEQPDNLAVTQVDDESRCASLGDAAKGVMQARQAGAARDAVADVLKPLGKDGERMLDLAYKYPVQDSSETIEQVTVEFYEGIQATCLSVAAARN